MQDSLNSSQQARQIDSHSLGVLAHEIKSPISSVIQLLYAAELLLQSPETEEALGLIRRAVKRAESALELARSMLDFTRLDRAKEFHDQDQDSVVPLADMEGLLEPHRQHAARKEITLISDLQGLERPLRIQPFSWQIIVNNLVTNAIRYSKRNQGPQRIWVRTAIEGDRFVLEVEDEGIGMTERDQRKLFEHFFRAVDAKMQTISGSGFGLAMVKMVVDEIGGEICCRSEYGVGTTFTVRIPLAG